MAKITYSEKLLDPRWQKKRLLILSRDNFQCQQCGDDKNTLHVHHKYYLPGLEPWSYEDHVLVTLCKGCHQDETDSPDYGAEVVRTLHDMGFLKEQLNHLLTYLRKIPRGSVYEFIHEVELFPYRQEEYVRIGSELKKSNECQESEQLSPNM